MTTPRKCTQALITMAAAVALTACVAHSNNPPGSTQYGSTAPEYGQAGNTAAGPVYYRGTESALAPINNDAAINANVVQAISRVSGGAANLQVTTSNGVVTLRGTADNHLVAQNDVQAARQVPGVQRVDYDIQVLGR